MVSMLAVAATGCGSDSKAGDTADANADTKTEQESASWDSSYDITIVSREDGSGTRGAFIELFGIEEKNGDEKVDMTTEEAQITNSTYCYDDDSGRRRVRDRIYFTRITGR